MLSKIKINNYALIENLEVSFFNGMSTITGETGAGKSIVLGALGLTLGARVDTSVLRDTNKKCVIETTFELSNYSLKGFFEENDLDFELETILRREIGVSGKSRAFINDTPVSLSVLKELSEYLIDVHSQHQTLAINTSEFQLSVLDSLAKNEVLLSKYQSKLKEYKSILKDLEKVKLDNEKLKGDLDFLQNQFDELDSISLESLKLEDVEDELNTLNNAEDIKRSLQGGINLLDGEAGVLSQINDLEGFLTQISGKNKNIDELLNRIISIKIELKDVLEEKETIEENIVYDEVKINELSDKFTLITTLLKKHNVSEIIELIDIKQLLEEKILNISSFDQRLTGLLTEKDKIYKIIKDFSIKLTNSRKKVIPGLTKEIEKLLTKLSMPDATFKVEQLESDEFTAKGKDEISFLFSANKGMDYKQIGKVASGGELSRLMLCIKKVLASSKALPTIIFDEIDTGVSGDVASKMGEVMKEVGSTTQVISITHLPQIASKGHNHYFVYKKVVDEKTYTKMRKLTPDERVRAIAQMLSGTDVSEAAIENAKSLLA